MTDEANDLLMVDDLLDRMSDDKMKIAFQRASREFDDCVVDYESPEFEEEFNLQLKLMVTKDFFRYLCERGYLEPSGVDEDGNVIYVETESKTNA